MGTREIRTESKSRQRRKKSESSQSSYKTLFYGLAIITLSALQIKFPYFVNYLYDVSENFDSSSDDTSSSDEGGGSGSYYMMSYNNSNNNDYNYHTSRDYLENRRQHFHSWFDNKTSSTDKLLPNADNNGPILDFIIAGFPKCGTTSMMINLAQVTTMPYELDICSPVHQIVSYSYLLWEKQFQKKNSAGAKKKLLKGSKCPQYIQREDFLKGYSTHLPRTKLIVGIRHPILWFESFWNMQQANHNLNYAKGDVYVLTEPCKKCNKVGCPGRQLFCLQRARFHLALASLGKTELTMEERNLLAPNDFDGGSNVQNWNIQNPLFLYDQKTLEEDYVWKDVSTYLGLNETIRHDLRSSSHGKNKNITKINLCDDHHDNFRAMMMPIAYNLSAWLQDYLIPIAKNKNRVDVTIPRPDTFAKLVEEYKVDPCGKLKRLNNGTYIRQTGRGKTRKKLDKKN